MASRCILSRKVWFPSSQWRHNCSATSGQSPIGKKIHIILIIKLTCWGFSLNTDIQWIIFKGCLLLHHVFYLQINNQKKNCWTLRGSSVRNRGFIGPSWRRLKTFMRLVRYIHHPYIHQSYFFYHWSLQLENFCFTLQGDKKNSAF